MSSSDRAADRHRTAVNDVAVQIGLPDAQRDPRRLAIAPAGVDGKPRPNDRTLRKLRRVEMLHRSGALQEHHVRAIDLYVSANEAAYGACLRVGSYGDGGGGSSPTGAAAAAHGRQLDRIGEAWRYDRARRAVPPAYVAAFERIVLDNHPIGAVGAEMWPGSSAGAVSGSMRELVRTCADAIYIEFERELGPAESLRVNLMKTMERMDWAVRAEKTVSPTPISDAVATALLKAGEGDALFVAPDVVADLMREGGLVEQPEAWGGYPLVVMPTWQFGWIVQAAPATA